MKSIDEALEKIANKKLLVVFPHPDDESVMAGGIIQRAIKLGFAVTVLTLTEGDRGKIYVNGKGRSTAEIRRQEMAEAMSRLGVTDWIMWKFDDGKLRKKKIWRDRLRKIIIETTPGVVVTYDFSGVTGHPDHICSAVETLRVVKSLKNTKLWWVSFDGLMKKRMVDKRVSKYLQKPEFWLDLDFFEAKTKWWAVFAHKSQSLAGFLGSPWWLLMFVARREWYYEARLERKYRYRFVSFRI